MLGAMSSPHLPLTAVVFGLDATPADGEPRMRRACAAPRFPRCPRRPPAIREFTTQAAQDWLFKEVAAIEDPGERERVFQERVAELYEHGKAVNAAAALEIDAVIDPADSRAWILAAPDGWAPEDTAPPGGRRRSSTPGEKAAAAREPRGRRPSAGARSREVRRPDILILPRAPHLAPIPVGSPPVAAEAAHNSRLVHRCW